MTADAETVDTRSDFVRVLDSFVDDCRADMRRLVTRLVAAEELQTIVNDFRQKYGREPQAESDLTINHGHVTRARIEALIDQVKGEPS